MGAATIESACEIRFDFQGLAVGAVGEGHTMADDPVGCDEGGLDRASAEIERDGGAR